jgi:uncharacterized protein YyaL (SSP411 family)
MDRAGDSDKTPRNRLQFEKSPYLLQHAGNPVDWYPWGEEAFEKAIKEDRPIFLSIGYSTCHWCHVMEKECFEDACVAALLNEAFVCIKVDREERPDIDNIYMAVCQMATGRGGWPLTILMTPDKKPFFAATYLPKESRYGRTGLMDLVPHVTRLWRTRREEVIANVRLNTDRLRRFSQMPRGAGLAEEALHEAFKHFHSRFDEQHGGFGEAPKFPTPHNLNFLLRYWNRTGNARALGMVERTLRSMRSGGIYDHVGFGFHRYSTDGEWFVPHFEKMLYDQALLALAYLEAYQATGHREYADTAREIFGYVLRDMTGPEGAFYSAEDADSEGVEGRFYVWTEQEIRTILDADTAELFVRRFGIRSDGNWVDVAGHGDRGTNILRIRKEVSDLALETGRTADSIRDELERARQHLFEVREARIHPYKDDKVLADWNGLMIAALARGAQVLGEERYAKAARGAAGFVMDRMRGSDGRLLHRYRDGEAAVQANLDDYAFLVWALLELYEATFETRHFALALELQAQQLHHFWDEVDGAFFFTPDNGEELLIRQKDAYDGAVPSGNSVAMLNLLRLARMTGEAGLEEKANQLGQALSGRVEQFPAGYTQLLCALTFAVGPSWEVILAGSRQSRDMKDMLGVLRAAFVPEKVVLLRHQGQEGQEPALESLAPFVKPYGGARGGVLAYVCSNHACKLPTKDPREVLKLLGGPSGDHP